MTIVGEPDPAAAAAMRQMAVPLVPTPPVEPDPEDDE